MCPVGSMGFSAVFDVEQSNRIERASYGGNCGRPDQPVLSICPSSNVCSIALQARIRAFTGSKQKDEECAGGADLVELRGGSSGLR